MSHAKTLSRFVSLALLIVASHLTHAAPLGTAFSYQGQLTSGGGPANGNYDLVLALFDDPAFGSQVGSTVTNSNVAVSNGLFTTAVDFGAGIFNGTAYWLAIGVRSNGSGAVFTPLSPRQPMTPSPYALYATIAPLADGSVTSAKILDGTIATADLANNSVNSAKIVDLSVATADLADNSVTSAKILDAAIVGADIANNTVGSAQLADTIALGATNVTGQLDVFRTSANTPAISLFGGSSQISTYGSDGLEQIRLWGVSYGEIILHNGLANNAVAVTLTAQSTIGGQLSLNSSNGSTRALLEGENSGGQLTLYQSDGQVGVFVDGDSGGAGLVSVRGTNGGTRATLDGSDGGGGAVRLYENDGTETVSLTSQANGNLVLRQGDGSSGVGLSANNGTGGGGVTIYRDSGAFAAQLTVAETTHDDGYLGLADGAGTTRLFARAWNGTGNGGYLGIIDSTGTQVITLDSDVSGSGRITTQVLQITGGSDLSENFDITSVDGAAKPGVVVCIDPKNPGQLIPSTRRYDRTVAGVISGAGGVKPGMLMGQKGTAADGQHPVALTGRVYCWADASHGAIQPGDLITTSDTPGHAMKVADHAQAQGAILGKAMTALENGKGLVLVLVSLQ